MVQGGLSDTQLHLRLALTTNWEVSANAGGHGPQTAATPRASWTPTGSPSALTRCTVPGKSDCITHEGYFVNSPSALASCKHKAAA